MAILASADRPSLAAALTGADASVASARCVSAAMRCSAACSAPTAWMTSRSSFTCASVSWAPIELRNSSAAAGSDLSASSTASASSTVRLPDRRSSPDGLPVTDGSPKTPSTSSRNWNATPRSTPNCLKVSWTSGRSAAAATPSCSGRATV